MKTKEFPILEDIEIIDIAQDGKCIAKHEDLVLFVANCVPGDLVDLQITKKKKNLAEATIINYKNRSEKLAPVFCSHFYTCGGCKWQHLGYEHQLAFKEKQVHDAIQRLAKIPCKEFLPIKGSEQQTFYRNKLEFTFSNKRWVDASNFDKEKLNELNNTLGFHVPKRFDKILQIEECFLQTNLSNTIRNSLYHFSVQHQLSFYDLRNHEGLLRNLIVRTSAGGELMIIVVFGEQQEDNIERVMSFLKNSFKEITSLLYIINKKKNDTIYDQEVIVYAGRDHIVEEMEGLKFKVGPKSFYQTNSKQAYELYKIARSFAQLKGNELVYDLYTGTGTIAQFVASSCKKVIGIEYVEAAIEDAKKNASINKINNVDFFAGDMKDVLNDEFIINHGAPDLVITDPPRAGMHASVVEKLLEITPEKIVYVSCNPATQARDIALLHSKYDLIKIQPVDMFPHTEHVETVALLEIRHDR